MRKKKIAAFMVAATMIMGSSMTAIAAQWTQEGATWKYQQADGTYCNNTWKWIDGKCYYFDGNGYMLSNTTTPDGYQVDASGAWVVNGVVQTQGTSATTNSAYPLAGMLEQLGLSYTGIEGWNDQNTLNLQNGPYLPSTGKYKYTNYGYAGLYAFACALSGEPYHDYWNETTDPIQAIAGINNVSYAEAQQMVGIVRDFLNSFDWKHSDDQQKARKAAELVTTGTKTTNQYYWENDVAGSNRAASRGYIAGILIYKEGGCNHFASTYHLLTRLMGMDSLHVVDTGHQYNFIKINGTWKIYDGMLDVQSNQEFTLSNIDTANFGNMIFPVNEARIELGIQ